MPPSPLEIPPSLLLEAAEILARSRRAVAFSGAGLSAESGIPTFRDPGGLWDRFDPHEISTPGGLLTTFLHRPQLVHTFLRETLRVFEAAVPNPGHLALAELERMGILRSVVTQNIDGLHGEAGNTQVYEIHGNLYRFRCLRCGRTRRLGKSETMHRFKPLLDRERPATLEEMQRAIPVCGCGGLMRPDVVLFGESVQQMPPAYIEAANSDVVLVLGTSGLVYPAANVPYEARKTGSTVIEINPGRASFADIADIHLTASTGEALPRLVEEVKRLRGG